MGLSPSHPEGYPSLVHKGFPSSPSITQLRCHCPSEFPHPSAGAVPTPRALQVSQPLGHHHWREGFQSSVGMW